MDFLFIDSLIDTRWTSFKVNSSTYNEMLNNGSYYTINSKKLKQQMDAHYIRAKGYESNFNEINKNSQEIAYNKDLFSLDVLRYRLRHPSANLNGIDTSWIHNPNSPIYTGYWKKITNYNQTNRTRRGQIRRFIKSCNALIESIKNELGIND